MQIWGGGRLAHREDKQAKLATTTTATKKKVREFVSFRFQLDLELLFGGGGGDFPDNTKRRENPQRGFIFSTLFFFRFILASAEDSCAGGILWWDFVWWKHDLG